MDNYSQTLKDLNSFKSRSSARKTLVNLGAQKVGELLISHLQNNELPDNAIWAIVDIFTQWKYKKGIPILINLLQTKPHLTSDITRALAKITGLDLGSNAEAWSAFLETSVNFAALRAAFQDHEIISFSIREDYCKIIVPTPNNRRQQVVVYEKDEKLTLYTECGYIHPEQIPGVHEFAKQIDFAKLAVEDEEGRVKVSFTAEWGSTEVDFPLLKKQIGYFAAIADDLEKQLTGKDAI